MLTLPLAKPSIARYGGTAFLLFWLGGWGVGWISAFRQITSGTGGAKAFLVFWLVAWTVGGGWVMWSLWKMLRQPIPETLLFAKPNLIYDTGVQRLEMSFGSRRQNDYWKKTFEKRKRIELTPSDLSTIKLRDTETDNRLTVDHGSERIDIGRTLTEVEREWLFELIKQEYKVQTRAIIS